MNAQLSTPARGRQSSGMELVLYAALFWVFTYALLTARAEMVLADSYALLGARRILATSVGAVIFWLVLRWIDRVARGASSSGFMPIIATILPASLAVLAVRVVADQVIYQTPPPLDENLRWVLVWAGYFGTCVSGALAIQMQRACRNKVRSAALVEAVSRDQAPAAQFDSWDWLVEECARHMAAVPVTTREALAEHLIARADYHAVEGFDDGTHNARVDLAYCIAGRLSGPS